MIKALMLSALSIILVCPSFAYPPKPANCPSVAKIKSGGLSNRLARDSNGKWYAGRTSMSYGTPQHWTFVIGDIFANSKVEALAEAYEALQSLKFNAGPIQAPSEKWLCLYSNSEGFPTGAITEPINDFTIMKNVT